MKDVENKKVNWFPGHMFKAKKEVQASLKGSDMVIEIVDSRAPISSHNEMLEEITNNKLKLVIFSKVDLVNVNDLTRYSKFYKNKGINTLFLDLHHKNVQEKVVKKIEEINKDLFERYKEKGIYKTLRILVIGMPNVGKSTFINSMAKKKKTVVGNRPGVTKAQQNIRISDNIELVDTPGILIPKISSLHTAYNLVLNSLIKDEVVELEDVAFYLLQRLIKEHKNMLILRYKNLEELDALYLDNDDFINTEKVYTLIAKSCGLYSNKSDIDYEKISIRIINDYRNQKFGKIILDEFYEN